MLKTHRNRPSEQVDVLSEILRVIRLSGDVFLKSYLTEPWSIASPSMRELCATLMPTANNLFLFHILAEGRCHVALDGGPTVELRAGEVILFPRAEVHRMHSHADIEPTPVLELLGSPSLDGIFRVTHGGRGSPSRMVCGYLGCEEQFMPIAEILPRALLLRQSAHGVVLETVDVAGDARPISTESAGWLETTLRYALVEASHGAPGSRVMLARLTELLFVEILRQFMRDAPSAQRGLVAAIADPQVGKALRMLHGAPARAWTVTTLARATGVSRAALADRFTNIVGEPPMRYLGRWRMQLARHLLTQERRSVAEIAELVGYESEAAFSRAFRRIVGQPPTAWRRSRVGLSPDA